MSGQLPPIDSDLREQLARRSAGRLPEGLFNDVSTALDSVPAPRAGLGWRPLRRSPRLAAAGLGAALVAILAVATAFPAFHAAPSASLAGYPAERALTTAELAALLAGTPLATNTTLIVSASIVFRNDICPMDRYQTVGVIYGIDPQVCIMGVIPGVQRATSVTGTFAFRFLGERSLGLLGQIAPASSSRLAFHVADDWPLTGQTFTVQGWLGSTRNNESCIYAPTAGDVLLPDGDSGCGYTNWLSADGTPPVQEPPTPTPDSSTAGGGSGADALKLYGKARLVQAEGVRIIDSIDHASSALGAYVVRSIVGPCPGDPPQSSTGCSAWRVLAKVADVPLQQSSPRPVSPTPPAPTPTITSAPIRPPDAPFGVIGELDFPLTEDALGQLMAADPSHLANRVAILQAPFGSGIVCGDATPAPSPVPCLILQNLVKGGGTWAVRIGSDGMFDVLGEVAPNPVSNSNGVVFDPAGAYAAWRAAGGGSQFYLVYGWLLAEINTGPSGSCDLLSLSPNSPCPPHDFVWLSGDGTKQDLALKPGDYELPRAGAAANGVYPPAQGLFLIQIAAAGGLSTVVAEFEPPTPAAVPTLTTAPPATPVVPPSGSVASPLGLLGPGNRPLTEGEFATLWAADPAHLAGRIAIVKGPVPTGFSCWSAGAADAGISAPTCHIAILDGQIAADGHYWAVSVGTDGKLAVVGEIAVPTNGYVFTLDQFVKSAANSGDRFLIVDAWLDWANDCDTLPIEPPGTVCGYSLLTSDRVDWMHMRSLWPSDSRVVAQYVQPNDAYQLFGSKDFGQAVHGLYLVHGTTILASLEATTP
jgi:hypothetical protein